MAGDMISAAVLGIAILLVLAFNIFFLVVFNRRKRLRTPATLPISMLLLHLALIDVIAALLWTLYTLLSAVNGEWFLGTVSDSSDAATILCKQQVYIMSFCNIVSAHTLMALMFERFLLIYKPSKRQEIVFDLVILLLIIALYVFDGVIASFSVGLFGEADYFSEQNQCAVDYEKSESHMKFTISMHFGIPMAVIIGLYVAILIRVRVLQRRRPENGPIVLEENLNAIGDSYADKLKAQYLKFKGAGSKSVKPKVCDPKPVDKDGFRSDDEDFNSDDEDNVADEAEAKSRDYVMKTKTRQEKKMYFLSRSDLHEAHMYALISAVYFACWIPYVVRSIIWTYYYYEIPISPTVSMATVCISHFCSCFKVPFYLISKRMRGAFRKTLGLKRSQAKFHTLENAETSADEFKQN